MPTRRAPSTLPVKSSTKTERSGLHVEQLQRVLVDPRVRFGHANRGGADRSIEGVEHQVHRQAKTPPEKRQQVGGPIIAQQRGLEPGAQRAEEFEQHPIQVVAAPEFAAEFLQLLGRQVQCLANVLPDFGASFAWPISTA